MFKFPIPLAAWFKVCACTNLQIFFSVLYIYVCDCIIIILWIIRTK
jgi:hypothetical protein